LGGYCNGALLAWEIAHQLRQAGREVESVVLIDALSLNSRPVFRVIHRMLNGMATLMPRTAQKMQLQRDGMRAIWNVARQSAGSKYGWIVAAIPPLQRRLAHQKFAMNPLETPFEGFGACYLRAMANYFPPKLDCDVDRAVDQTGAQGKSHGRPGRHKSCITTQRRDQK
jgi:thioesterase domain-containing protein